VIRSTRGENARTDLLESNVVIGGAGHRPLPCDETVELCCVLEKRETGTARPPG
jgi:hypothetical protein